MERRTALLAAGTVAGLVLFALLALGLGSGQASGSTPTWPWADAPDANAAVPVVSTATDAQLRAENEQLRSLLATMQAREATYREQIESANQSLLAQQTAIVSDSATSDAGRTLACEDEYKEHEDERDNHEARVQREHRESEDDD
jgi:hypothetical protein